MTHGKIINHARKCEQHGEHGVLYPCACYSQETLDEIERMNVKYRANLMDPEWVERQGMPPEVIAVFRVLAGL